jgi:8-oxo-dGTP pyrophosphatase MutT (NUDIX family)
MRAKPTPCTPTTLLSLDLMSDKNMRNIERKIVSIVLLSKDQKILFFEEDPNYGGIFPENLHIPGGGLKDGETLSQGAIRETFEEVGIKVDSGDLELVSDSITATKEKTLETGERVIANMTFFDYLVYLDQNTDKYKLTLAPEILKPVWIDVQKVATANVTPTLKTLMTKLDVKFNSK